MPHIDNALRTRESIPSKAHHKGSLQRARTKQAGHPVAGVLAILVLACLGLSACGGSSGSSTNAAATAATSATAGSKSATTSTNGSSNQGTRPAGQRFSAIRECLQKNGVTLPKRTPGSGGGPALPKGMTRTQFEAVLRKCGGGNFGARFGEPNGQGARADNPVFRQALGKFAACLRQKGVNIPAPNTSGNGPIFSTKGINTKSPQFTSATKACRSVLVGAFKNLRPRGGAARAGSAPPATGQTTG